jgi:protocatechuate 3,4-dioxygenase beta subunit
MELRLMNKPTRCFFLLLIATLLHCFNSEASACSCGSGGGAPCEEFWRVDAVFTGRVTGSSQITVDEGEYKSTQRVVRLTVEQRFRGAVEDVETEVITGLGGGDCGYEFKMGGRYIVYAYRNEKDHKLYTSICSRTRTLAEAADDLAFVRELSTTRDAAGSVFGRVVKRNYQWKEGENVFKPVPGVDVLIEGVGKKYEARSDGQGHFRVAGLPPGTYKVKIRVPEGLTTEGMKNETSRLLEGEVTLVARGCAEREFYLESDTRVAGRVLDATAQPVAHMRLEMRPAPNNRNNYNALLYAETDAEGRFEFKEVPPGIYLLGFRIIGATNTEPLPYPRIYYPGVPTRAQAGIVSVKEGERVRDLELRMLPRLEEINLEGTVVWADGRPAPGAGVNVSLFEEGEMTVYRWLKADERGRFTLKVFSGANYKVNATLQTDSGASAQSKWIDLQAAPGASPINLVLYTEPAKP